MQKGIVFYNGTEAGIISRTEKGEYVFQYTEAYCADNSKPGISLTLPKTQKEYTSDVLFPFFYGLLAEGINKEIQCRLLKIDEKDDFTRLLKTANTDTIGAVTVKEQ